MTPSDVINEVLDDLERDDLIQVAESKFQAALKSAHAVDSFAQDLMQVDFDITNLIVNQGKTSIVPPDGFRKVWDLRTIDSSGGVFPDGFRNQRNLQTLRDYFGFQIPRTFSQFGKKNINLTGVDANASAIRLTYLSFPVVTVATDGTLSADSWILDEFPQMVSAYLKWYLAPVTQQEDVANAAAQQVQNYHRELLSIYVEELLGEPRL